MADLHRVLALVEFTVSPFTDSQEFIPRKEMFIYSV